MSQLLSHAQRNYEEGVLMINSGQRATGLAKFEEARQLTREVKLMFPVNQEAGILELRMEQFTDPAAFNAAFEQRLNAAVAGTKPPQRSVESFADLQNLAEINPRYPNMRAIITQAEIDMGYRPPPPNPANIARSRELTASASRILEGNISTQYEVAIEQINEAIRLNPDNTDAARVKDRLLNRMSVPGAVVLTSEDEEDYQRAMRELQAGNNLVAFALVERLMQNPRNRNITKLIELQRRIQSVIQ
jgi:tetratricopeptide (TPR) repeat protein